MPSSSTRFPRLGVSACTCSLTTRCIRPATSAAELCRYASFRPISNGGRHQKFLVRLSPDHTILIAHNIDLAPRINALREGDDIQFSGEYVWNEKGGVIHWTHRDPQGLHEAGCCYIKVKNINEQDKPRHGIKSYALYSNVTMVGFGGPV